MKHNVCLPFVVLLSTLICVSCGKKETTTVKYELKVSRDLLQIANPEILIVENGVNKMFTPSYQDFVRDTHTLVFSRIIVSHNGISDTVLDSCYYYVYTIDFVYDETQPVCHTYVPKYVPVGQPSAEEFGYYDQTTGVTCTSNNGYYTRSASIAVNQANAIEYLARLQTHPDTIEVEISKDGKINVFSNRD